MGWQLWSWILSPVVLTPLGIGLAWVGPEVSVGVLAFSAGIGVCNAFWMVVPYRGMRKATPA